MTETSVDWQEQDQERQSRWALFSYRTLVLEVLEGLDDVKIFLVLVVKEQTLLEGLFCLR